MRDPKRINRILIKLMRAWQTGPDLRLCQLIENLVGCGQDRCLFYVEDDELEESLNTWLRTINRSTP